MLATGAAAQTPPVVTISGGPAITEGEQIKFVVTASSPPTSNLNVRYRLDNPPGSEFVPPGSEFVQFREGSGVLNANTRTSEIGASSANDSVDEPSGWVTITLLPGSGYKVGSPSVARVWVNDNDGGDNYHLCTSPTPVPSDTMPPVNLADAIVFEFAQSSFSVSVLPTEREPSATVTVTRTGTRATSVDYATANGSLTAPGGYTHTAGTLRFAAGETSKSFLVPVSGAPGTFRVFLSNATNGGAVCYPSAIPYGSVVHVSRRTPLDLSFSRSSLSVAENGSASYTVKLDSWPVDGDVTVTITGMSGTDVTVDTDPGTAGNQRTLTFPAVGHLWNRPQTVTVSAADDSDTVWDRVTLTHTASANYDSIARDLFVVVDDDDGDTSIIELTQTAIDTGEGYEAVVTVRNFGGGAATVDWATADGSAQSPGDFTAASGTLSFASGETRKTITVPIIDDGSPEEDESFTITLSNPSGAVLGADHTATVTATVTIRQPVIEFSDTVYYVREDEGEAVITIRKIGGGAATVRFATEAITGSPGLPFAEPPGDREIVVKTVSFAATDTKKTVAVPIVDDGVDELDEQFGLDLSRPKGARLNRGVGGHKAFVVIRNYPELPLIRLDTDVEALYLDVREDEGPLTIAVTKTGTATKNASIDYRIVHSTRPRAATVGIDYTDTRGTLTFTPSETRKTISVPIIDDGVDEPEEDFHLVLEDPVGATMDPRARSLGIDVAFITLIDDDSPPVLRFSERAQLVDESEGEAVLTVTKTGATSRNVTVKYATADETATAPGDYTDTSGTLTIEPSETEKTITVPLAVDSVAEDSEYFTVSLSSPSHATVDSDKNKITVIVREDVAPRSGQVEATPPVVTISADADSVTEGGDVTFTVTADPAPGADLTVNLSADEEMGEGGGYIAQTHLDTVTIAAGTTSATWTLTTMSDDVERADGAVVGSISAGDGYTLGAPSSVSLTLLDDDGPQDTPDGAKTQTETPTIPADLVASVRELAGQTQHGSAHVNRWRRVLVAFGLESYPGLTPTTAAEARTNAEKYSSPLWPRIAEVLEKLEAAPEPPPEVVPEVTVAAGAAVTEGGDAIFTITASPPPPEALAVSVSVAIEGDYGVTAGSRTVTVGATGSATLTIGTTDDAVDEADGSVTATVAAGDGYTVGSPASGSVAVSDDDEPEITLTAGSAVSEGGNVAFTLTASPAPAADLSVSVSVVVEGDYGVAGGSRTVTVGTNGHGLLRFATVDDNADEPDGSITATVEDGEGYTVGAAASGTVAVSDDDLPPPVISVAAKAASVTEGEDAVFVLTADRAPEANLTVQLVVAETGGDHAGADSEGATGVTFLKGETEAELPVVTVDDDADEPDGTVTVTLSAGDGYTVAAAPGDTAGVTVTDNDAAALPVLSVADERVEENGGALLTFTVRLSAASSAPVEVVADTRDSDPVSAVSREDYWPVERQRVRFRAGETQQQVSVVIYDDSHDENPETFELVLSEASGAEIGDGVAVGTIVNDDPLPAAFVARMGRTVAEQALEGVAGRMSAPREAGMRSTLAGQTLSFGGPSGGGAGSVPASAGYARGGLAPVFGGQTGGQPGGFGHGNAGFGAGGLPGSGYGPSPGLTGRDVLLGSGFTLTGAADAGGGSLAMWGRTARGSFHGREGAHSLGGGAFTTMLGTDYAHGRLLAGVALARSAGDGEYQNTEAGSGACPDGMSAALCDRARRAGDGRVGASLTAAIPYAAFRLSERVKVWGAAGYGAGEAALRTELGSSFRTDTRWRMASAGLRGDLLAVPTGGGDFALAAVSDALWTHTTSAETRDLAASASGATRLRLGLEGSYRVSLPGGGRLAPKVEVGARHDGGDSETGPGVEIGGGFVWTDPRLGLSLDVAGRTLVAHGNEDLKDRGFAVAVGFDPRPSTKRGLSLDLRQELGRQARGGLDALFRPATLGERIGGEGASRWSLAGAYGLATFGGRFTGSPHAEVGVASGARDYNVGWRLAREGENAPDLRFGVRASRRESVWAGPGHAVGIEISGRW